MKKLVCSAALVAMGFVSSGAFGMDIMARVLSSTPIVQQVAVPRQVCTNQSVMAQLPKSGGGALLGAVTGGVVGHAMGGGNGKTLATMLGVMGGAMVGDNIESANSQVQNVVQCSTQTVYENRTSLYNVVYEYQGAQYSAQMASDPGPYIRLQVTPVGAVNMAPQTLTSRPQTYYQAAAAQTFYAPVAVAPQVIYQTAPYYSRPYYAPVGLSLGYGYGYSYGHRHWH